MAAGVELVPTSGFNHPTEGYFRTWLNLRNATKTSSPASPLNVVGTITLLNPPPLSLGPVKYFVLVGIDSWVNGVSSTVVQAALENSAFARPLQFLWSNGLPLKVRLIYASYYIPFNTLLTKGIPVANVSYSQVTTSGLVTVSVAENPPADLGNLAPTFTLSWPASNNGYPSIGP